MESPGINNQPEKPATGIYVERDVLGLEKTPANATGTKASPNKIFITLAVIIIAALAYWFITGR